MRKSESRTLTVLGALLLLASPAAASGYKSLAKRISKAVTKAGVERIAVAPFSPMGGRDAGEGEYIAEKLATRLALHGKAQVLERGVLAAVLEEHRLGRTGLLDRRSLSRLGVMQQAEAVVSGTFAPLGREVELNVRVVHIETGRVLAARCVRVRRDWFPASASVIPAPRPISADDAIADVYEYQTGRKYRSSSRQAATQRVLRAYRRGTRYASMRRNRVFPAETVAVPDEPLRDAVRDICSGAAEQIDAWQADILELKARYWAREIMKQGFDIESVAARPGAVISDPELKLTFYELIKDAAATDAEPLSGAEVQKFIELDRRSMELHASCRL